MRILIALAAAAALAGCNGNSGTAGGGNAAAPVAAAPAPAGTKWTDTVQKTAEGGYRMGNPDAAIKLVEYGSRTCPTCGVFGREGMPKLIENYVSTGKVSFEFRDFMVHGAPDLAASVLGHCTTEATFFPMLEQMYQGQMAVLETLEATPPEFQAAQQGKQPGAIATAWAERLGYIDFFKQRGVPEAKARACLGDPKLIDSVVKLTDAAASSGKVTGTPTFLINDEPATGVLGWEQLEPALKAAGA